MLGIANLSICSRSKFCYKDEEEMEEGEDEEQENGQKKYIK